MNVILVRVLMSDTQMLTSGVHLPRVQAGKGKHLNDAGGRWRIGFHSR